MNTQLEEPCRWDIQLGTLMVLCLKADELNQFNKIKKTISFISDKKLLGTLNIVLNLFLGFEKIGLNFCNNRQLSIQIVQKSNGDHTQ